MFLNAEPTIQQISQRFTPCTLSPYSYSLITLALLNLSNKTYKGLNSLKSPEKNKRMFN